MHLEMETFTQKSIRRQKDSALCWGGRAGWPFSPDSVQHQEIYQRNCSWGGRTIVKRAINPHVLSNVPELSCRSTWDLDAVTLLYVTWGSACVQPRMKQMLPICHQDWHERDLSSWFGWSCGFGSSSCLSCLLPLVKLRLHMQSVSHVAPEST